jgi:hypothetical protein
MLSSLPKLADRNFILGQLLPTLLFAVAALLLFRDQMPVEAWIDILTGKDLGTTAFLLLGVWVVAVTTLMLNLWIYRFLEGYTFPRWLADILKRRNGKRLQRSLRQIQTLYDQWAEQGNAFSQANLERYQTLRCNLVQWMPPRESDILPTRFGNAIKAFEVYPRDVYGADGIVIWLRLATVMPKQFVEQIQVMRAQIDCLINCCFFSVVTASVAVIRAIYSSGWHYKNLQTFAGVYDAISGIEKAWPVWTLGAAIAAYLFYRWAVACVPAWGELVMSAFDCYLPALAGQLGFELPKTEAMRREFWTTLSQQLIYRREPNGKLPFRVENWTQVGKEQTFRAVDDNAKQNSGATDTRSPDHKKSFALSNVDLSGDRLREQYWSVGQPQSNGE